MNPIDNILARLPSARRSGNGWLARCPAHDDRKPSLSIGFGDDGRVLLNCHRGCQQEAIAQSIGLKMKDLFVPSPTRNGFHGGLNSFNGTFKSSRDTGRVPPESKPTPAFATLPDAISVYQRSLGGPSDVYLYLYADGSEAGTVVRWQTPGGKEIRQFRKDPDGWRCKAMDEPRTLYNLQAVLKLPLNEPVYVVEGEKCVDALTALGQVAVTSAGGSLVAGKSDWSPLKGRRVVIVPDNDEPGRTYAEDVRRLATAAGAASVEILDLSKHWPSCPKGGDVADMLAADDPPWGDAAEAGDIAVTLLSWAELWPVPLSETVSAEAAGSDTVVSPTNLEFRAYPVAELPATLNSIVSEIAWAVGCDPSFVAPAMLAGLGATVGNSWRLFIKNGWRVPPLLWPVLVGESGSVKSPPLRAVVKPYEHDGELAAAWSKLEELPARMALILHAVVEADRDTIGGDTMRRAIALTEWHKHETERVYTLLGESEGERDQRRLLDTIRRKWPDGVSVREFQRGNQKRYRTSESARTVLEALVKAGQLRRESEGGRYFPATRCDSVTV